MISNQFLRCNREVNITLGEERGMKTKLLCKCIEMQSGGDFESKVTEAVK